MNTRRIAEYAFLFSDKAVVYEKPDKMLVSLKNMLSDRDTLSADRHKYEMQLHDQKGYMSTKDYIRKKRSWSAVVKTLDKQIKSLLHLVAVSVATHMKSGEYKDYYKRKTEEGIHPMCVLNVIRSKLVSRMFAVVKRDEAYQRNYKTFTTTEKSFQKTIANS